MWNDTASCAGVVGEDRRRLRQSPKHIDLREEHSHKEKLEQYRRIGETTLNLFAVRKH
jgi:hypothetical protein